MTVLYYKGMGESKSRQQTCRACQIKGASVEECHKELKKNAQNKLARYGTGGIQKDRRSEEGACSPRLLYREESGDRGKKEDSCSDCGKNYVGTKGKGKGETNLYETKKFKNGVREEELASSIVVIERAGIGGGVMCPRLEVRLGVGGTSILQVSVDTLSVPKNI